MHIYVEKSLAHHMFKCQREGKNILLEYFWFVFSVLSVRIILDIAYCRNMGGSWARDWESHCRVSPVPCVWNLQLLPRSLTELFLLFVPRLDFLSIINISKRMHCWVLYLTVCKWKLLPHLLVQVRALCVMMCESQCGGRRIHFPHWQGVVRLPTALMFWY